MKVGVMLPSFNERAEVSLEAARRAEAAGLHGVFAYQHLWPIGHPGRPAIWPFPLLGAVAATTSRLLLGTLVARVAIAPRRVLLGELLALDELSGGRLVAGVGTGDAKSREENLAYGLPYAPAAARRAELGRVVEEVIAAGIPTWVGGGGEQTHLLARRLGATLNLWGATAQQIGREAALGPVSWGGRWPGPSAGRPGSAGTGRSGEADRAAVELLVALGHAGASWAVFTWPGSVEVVALAAQRAGVVLQPAPPTAA